MTFFQEDKQPFSEILAFYKLPPPHLLFICFLLPAFYLLLKSLTRCLNKKFILNLFYPFSPNVGLFLLCVFQEEFFHFIL